MNNYLDLANSNIVFVLCAVVILVVFVQATLFVRKAWKRGIELEMDAKDLKKAVYNSAALSMVPSFPIIVMMLALSVPLGRFFPWLRLSIVGSAIYEGTAANVAAQAMGLTDISDPGMTPEIFVIVMFVMTIGIIWGILFNIFFMKKLDTFMKGNAATLAGGFMGIFSGTLFIAMLITLSTPFASNIANPNGIVAFFTSAATALTCNWAAKKFNKPTLGDFSLPISLIVGMIVVILVANL